MIWPRRPTIWTIVVAILAALTSPIWSVEIETVWLETIRPYVVANAWSWVVNVLDHLSGFWGGVFVSLVILVAFDLFFSARKRGRWLDASTGTLFTLYRQRRPFRSDTKLDGMVKSHRDDHDLIPAGLVVRGMRYDDGIDISATIKYRNRSKHPITLQSDRASFEVEGKAPVGKLSPGISALVPPEKTSGLRFNPVRVYNEKRPSKGSAAFTVKFGPSAGTMYSALKMSYQFTVLSYPKNKASEEVLNIESSETIDYYAEESR